MDLEATIDMLRAVRPPTCALSISKRELAEMIINHRHNKIRAKTVNHQMFRTHRYDQFYWYVDERTLLGRQMPIAVIYMRPERELTEMPTFWDFTGSHMSAHIVRWFASRLTRHNLARLGSNLAFAATLAICAPLARFASRIEERQNPRRFRAHCTSMTIEIDLP